MDSYKIYIDFFQNIFSQKIRKSLKFVKKVEKTISGKGKNHHSNLEKNVSGKGENLHFFGLRGKMTC